MVRLIGAGVTGAAVLIASAVVLGDYPVTGSVMWSAAVLVPLLIGIGMSLVLGGAGSNPRVRSRLWAVTGLMAAGAMAWGLRIATGWGLDPTPVFAWIAVAAAGLWPEAWALRLALRRPVPASGPATPAT